MTDGSTMEDISRSADAFLSPVLTRADGFHRAKGLSLLDQLASSTSSHEAENGSSMEKRNAVIEKALGLILSFHDALTSQATHSHAVEYNPKTQKLVDALLDLISLEGIYPCLSPGVGIPVERRVRSMLPAGITAQPVSRDMGEESSCLELLQRIIKCIYGICLERSQGLEPRIRERILVDIVAACAEMAFSPASSTVNDSVSKEYHKDIFQKLLDHTSTPDILRLLTSLLHPATPQWLRPHIASPLARVPLRTDGVRQTVYFISATMPTHSQPVPTNSGAAPGTTAGNEPALSLDAITQSSKLLGSVPSELSPDVYFKAIGPQLWDMLDGEDPGMVSAAAYIIGNGILGHREYGAPGTVGWKLFAEPLLRSLNPTPEQREEAWRKQPSTELVGKTVLVPHEQLMSATKRLSSILLLHPNPGLTKRLLSPLMLPLWGIVCVLCQSEHNEKDLYDRARSLLEAYFKVSAGVDQMDVLSQNLLWRGPKEWTYMKTADHDEVCIVIHKSRIASLIYDMESLMNDLVTSSQQFIKLVQSSCIEDDEIGNLFLKISKRWLAPDSRLSKYRNGLLEFDEIATDGSTLKDAMINAKVVQDMLQAFKGKLTSNASKIFELVDQLLGNFIEERLRQKVADETFLASLGHIISSQSPKVITESEALIEEAPAAAFSFLSVILYSPNFALTASQVNILRNIHEKIRVLDSNLSLSAALKTSASTHSRLLTRLLSQHAGGRSTVLPDSAIPDLSTYRHALTLLGDPIPPIRAEGLSLINSLITHASPIIDVSVTTQLLLSSLLDSDDYVYLTTIRVLTTLVSLHSAQVLQILSECYVDATEELTLDQRLRLGEALMRSIEKLGSAFVGKTAHVVCEAAITVASRRGQRPKDLAEQRRQVVEQERKHEEAAAAWGGSVPELPSAEDEAESAAEAEETLLAEGIMSGWHVNASGEEDPRMRASALSVLGAAFTSSITGVEAEVINLALDVSLSVLNLEPEAAKTVVRRAAVLLILGVLKGLDRARDEGRQPAFGMAITSTQKGEELRRVLQYVQHTDNDDMVREHADTVLESLDNWTEKGIIEAVREARARAGAEREIRIPGTGKPKPTNIGIEEIE